MDDALDGVSSCPQEPCAQLAADVVLRTHNLHDHRAVYALSRLSNLLARGKLTPAQQEVYVQLFGELKEQLKVPETQFRKIEEQLKRDEMFAVGG